MALELTQDVTALPPLLIASFTAYAVTVLLMKRSILTEKVARRGHHITREYSIDPLERSTIAAVMSTDVILIPASMPVKALLAEYFFGVGPKRHQAYPVVDAAGLLIGIITRSDLLKPRARDVEEEARRERFINLHLPHKGRGPAK